MKESNSTPTIGLLLGLGPVAGVTFYSKYQAYFSGYGDLECPRVISYSHRTIKDVPLTFDPHDHAASNAVKDAMNFFIKNKADLILAPCNSLMLFKRQLEEYSGIEIIDIIDCVTQYIHQNHQGCKQIGILSTEHTVHHNLYEKSFRQRSDKYKFIYPNEKFQEATSKAIIAVKLGKHLFSDQAHSRICSSINHLASQGADLVILGCTELPCAFEETHYNDVPVINSTDILAQFGAERSKQLCGLK